MFDTFDDDADVQRARDRLQAAGEALGGGNRWGETRRFAGRSAGVRLERYHRAQAALARAYDRAEKRRRRGGS